MTICLRRKVLILALLLFVGIAAYADTATYILEYGNSGLCGGGSSPSTCPGGKDPTPYGSVTLTLSGDAKSITVTVQLSGSNVLWASGGSPQVFGFNYVGGSSALNISGVSSGFYGSGGTHMDGFGNFQYSISALGSQAVGNTLTFTVTRADGGTFGSVNNLNFANGNGFGFAVDIASCATCGNRVTGFGGALGTDGGNLAPVPEPATMMMLGTGLFAAGGILRRRRRQKPNSEINQ